VHDQIGGLDEVGLLGELFDRIAAVAQDARSPSIKVTWLSQDPVLP
jgi:hypothetical protein